MIKIMPKVHTGASQSKCDKEPVTTNTMTSNSQLLSHQIEPENLTAHILFMHFLRVILFSS